MGFGIRAAAYMAEKYEREEAELGDRGRKSAAEIATANGTAVDPAYEPPPAPKDLKAPEKKLWEEVIASRTPGFYGPGDLPLLEQYCYLMKTLVPKIRKQIEKKFSRENINTLNSTTARSESLARALRISVISRTRPDSKKIEDSLPGNQTPYVE